MESTSSALSVYPGAITTSRNIAASSLAVASSTSLLKATIPPNELTGSQALAFRKASTTLSSVATPQGLLCLTTTHAPSL